MGKNCKHGKFSYAFKFHEYDKALKVWKSSMRMEKFCQYGKVQSL